MTIRVNDVTIMKNAGASERTVSSARIWMTTAVCPRVAFPKSREIEGPFAAKASAWRKKMKVKAKPRRIRRAGILFSDLRLNVGLNLPINLNLSINESFDARRIRDAAQGDQVVRRRADDQEFSRHRHQGHGFARTQVPGCEHVHEGPARRDHAPSRHHPARDIEQPHHQGQDDAQRDDHPRDALPKLHRAYPKCWIRSTVLTTSVKRMPNFSLTTTTSPRATNRLFTRTSKGSPASFSNSITDPCPNCRRSRMSIRVDPSCTDTCIGISRMKSRFLIDVSPSLPSNGGNVAGFGPVATPPASAGCCCGSPFPIRPPLAGC